MSAQNSNPNYFNETTCAIRRKRSVKTARVLVLSVAALCIVTAIGIYLSGEKLPTDLLIIGSVFIGIGLSAPERRLVKPGWPKPTVECARCHGQGWPEDLTAAQACPVCGHDKLGRPTSKRTQRNAKRSASGSVPSERN